jgi:hypothetical protein
MIGKGRKQKAHLLALAVPDEARQPNAIPKIMQLDRDLGIHRHRRNLSLGKFNEHPLNTEVEHATLTNCALPTTNGNRKRLLGLH